MVLKTGLYWALCDEPGEEVTVWDGGNDPWGLAPVLSESESSFAESPSMVVSN